MFSGVYLGEAEGLTKRTRRPIPIKDVYKVKALGRKLDDEPRWLIALISDTGMRLSEATGLKIDDVKLDDPHPHILLQPQPLRRVKTLRNTSMIPLVGPSLWPAKRLSLIHIVRSRPTTLIRPR